VALRVFFALSGLIWLPYGLFCLVQPDFLEGAAGIASSSPTGTTELRAMYGGLQAAIGTLMLAALVRPRLSETALVVLAFLCAGLGLARLVGAVADGAFSSYTVSALLFEFGLFAIATFFLRTRFRPRPG